MSLSAVQKTFAGVGALFIAQMIASHAVWQVSSWLAPIFYVIAVLFVLWRLLN